MSCLILVDLQAGYVDGPDAVVGAAGLVAAAGDLLDRARQAAWSSGLEVVLPHDAHATCDIPELPGIAPAVPAVTVARVAEWALGEELELVAVSHDVLFARRTADV